MLVVNPLGVKESDGVEVREAVIGSSVEPELTVDEVVVVMSYIEVVELLVEVGMVEELLETVLEPRVLVSVFGVKVLVTYVVVVLSSAELVKGVKGYGL